MLSFVVLGFQPPLPLHNHAGLPPPPLLLPATDDKQQKNASSVEGGLVAGFPLLGSSDRGGIYSAVAVQCSSGISDGSQEAMRSTSSSAGGGMPVLGATLTPLAGNSLIDGSNRSPPGSGGGLEGGGDLGASMLTASGRLLAVNARRPLHSQPWQELLEQQRTAGGSSLNHIPLHLNTRVGAGTTKPLGAKSSKPLSPGTGGGAAPVQGAAQGGDGQETAESDGGAALSPTAHSLKAAVLQALGEGPGVAAAGAETGDKTLAAAAAATVAATAAAPSGSAGVDAAGPMLSPGSMGMPRSAKSSSPLKPGSARGPHGMSGSLGSLPASPLAAQAKALSSAPVAVESSAMIIGVAVVGNRTPGRRHSNASGCSISSAVRSPRRDLHLQPWQVGRSPSSGSGIASPYSVSPRVTAGASSVAVAAAAVLQSEPSLVLPPTWQGAGGPVAVSTPSGHSSRSPTPKATVIVPAVTSISLGHSSAAAGGPLITCTASSFPNRPLVGSGCMTGPVSVSFSEAAMSSHCSLDALLSRCHSPDLASGAKDDSLELAASPQQTAESSFSSPSSSPKLGITSPRAQIDDSAVATDPLSNDPPTSFAEGAMEEAAASEGGAGVAAVEAAAELKAGAAGTAGGGGGAARRQSHGQMSTGTQLLGTSAESPIVLAKTLFVDGDLDSAFTTETATGSGSGGKPNRVSRAGSPGMQQRQSSSPGVLSYQDPIAAAAAKFKVSPEAVTLAMERRSSTGHEALVSTLAPEAAAAGGSPRLGTELSKGRSVSDGGGLGVAARRDDSAGEELGAFRARRRTSCSRFSAARRRSKGAVHVTSNQQLCTIEQLEAMHQQQPLHMSLAEAVDALDIDFGAVKPVKSRLSRASRSRRKSIVTGAASEPGLRPKGGVHAHRASHVLMSSKGLPAGWLGPALLQEQLELRSPGASDNGGSPRGLPTPRQSPSAAGHAAAEEADTAAATAAGTPREVRESYFDSGEGGAEAKCDDQDLVPQAGLEEGAGGSAGSAGPSAMCGKLPTKTTSVDTSPAVAVPLTSQAIRHLETAAGAEASLGVVQSQGAAAISMWKQQQQLQEEQERQRQLASWLANQPTLVSPRISAAAAAAVAAGAGAVAAAAVASSSVGATGPASKASSISAMGESVNVMPVAISFVNMGLGHMSMSEIAGAIGKEAEPTRTSISLSFLVSGGSVSPSAAAGRVSPIGWGGSIDGAKGAKHTVFPMNPALWSAPTAKSQKSPSAAAAVPALWSSPSKPGTNPFAAKRSPRPGAMAASAAAARSGSKSPTNHSGALRQALAAAAAAARLHTAPMPTSLSPSPSAKARGRASVSSSMGWSAAGGSAAAKLKTAPSPSFGSSAAGGKQLPGSVIPAAAAQVVAAGPRSVATSAKAHSGTQSLNASLTKGSKPGSPRRHKLTAPEILARSGSATRDGLRQALPYLHHAQSGSLKAAVSHAASRECETGGEEVRRQQQPEEQELGAAGLSAVEGGAEAGSRVLGSVAVAADEKGSAVLEALLSQLDPNWQQLRDEVRVGIADVGGPRKPPVSGSGVENTPQRNWRQTRTHLVG